MLGYHTSYGETTKHAQEASVLKCSMLPRLARWGWESMRSELVGREVLHWWGRIADSATAILLIGSRSVSPGVKHATYEMKVENWNMGTLINCSATEPG